MPTAPPSPRPPDTDDAAIAPLADCDLLVIGSGAGGLSAAVSAAHLGLKVVVLEKEAVLGGTSAWSGGWMWIPRNPLARAAGIEEDLEGPRRYLRATLGDAVMDHPQHRRRLEAFLTHGPAMVAFHQGHTRLRFLDGNAIPDFHGRADAARSGGRSVCAAPFDARALGAEGLALLRPPLDVLAWLGLSIGGDLRHFLRANRAADSAWYVARRIARQLTDRLLHGQGTLRMGGNALVAALLASALEKGVSLRPRHAAQSLLLRADADSPTGQRVVGARVSTPQGDIQLRARCGVVCAAGGFPHELARKAALFAHAPTGAEHFSAATDSNTGDGLRLAEGAGAWVDSGLADAGAWCPVSRVPLPGGGFRAFPHLAERGKPGLIAVDAQARRFGNEAGNYHSFMRALFARHAAEPVAPGQPLHAWLLCDARFIRRYGLGFAKPWPFFNRALLTQGYLKRGRNWAELASACGLDANALQATVQRYNHSALLGRDEEFRRGETPYERMQGDAEHPGPNPCVAPLVQAPFYAVQIVPGSLGTFAGLATNEHAQVTTDDGRPLPGLYAVGNDAASLMRGHYPSGGITLGPAMTFGHVLAHHAAGQPLPTPSFPS